MIEKNGSCNTLLHDVRRLKKMVFEDKIIGTKKRNVTHAIYLGSQLTWCLVFKHLRGVVYRTKRFNIDFSPEKRCCITLKRSSYVASGAIVAAVNKLE